MKVNTGHRIKDFAHALKVGPLESYKMGLDKYENWTPLLIYIHATRMIMGFACGFLVGAGIICTVFFILLGFI